MTEASPGAEASRKQKARPPTPIVVGIGASAGGLEALEAFFLASQPLRHCAFVVVQHLSADQPSVLPELIQRSTGLVVRAAEDDAAVEPGHVDVAPPGFEVQLRGGRIVLLPQPEGHGLRLPIDSFFRSLAEDRPGGAVGVILSGMGSDGTLGLRALKARAGATFVQSPDTASFDSMPRSAVQAGVVDVAATAADLPAEIAAFLGHRRPPENEPAPSDAQADAAAIESIVAVLRAQTGHDFAMYKKRTVQRRIERRMALHHKSSFAEYEQLLRGNKPESDLLFKELLIGVTSFFRDPPVWAQLERESIPELLASRPEGGTLRIWVVACSTGEEAYSLAMLFIESIEKIRPARSFTLKIFATDIDPDSIERARAGRFPVNVAADVSVERLARFFVQDEFGYRVNKSVRETVIFALQNVARDPPFTKLDMLVCRNLLIYFEPALQKRLFPLFHYSLEPGGLLMLGSSETVGATTDYFAPVAGSAKLFRRLDSFRQSGFVAFPATFDRPPRLAAPGTPESAEGRPNLQELADHLLLQRYSPAAVLVTPDGDVLYISGKTGKYLEPAAGKANWNLFVMARGGLRQALAKAFHEAVRERRSVKLPSLIVDADVGQLAVEVTVDPISSPKALGGMVMVVFVDRELRAESSPTDAPAASVGKSAVAAAHELTQARDALRAAREDAQHAEEQSRAANEELQSTNEELQSTNEELTTSKEEMQSMNEELQTVNQELQAKIDELSQASDDMRNLLNSTDIATLFLDERLRIRRFTQQTVAIFKLIAADVGRPITDITNDLTDWAIGDDAREVLSSLVFREKEVAASDNRWFKVRTMPYRTFQNHIDGVVITFSDVTKAKLLEIELTAAKAALESRLSRRR